jgi:hypothetical protein
METRSLSGVTNGPAAPWRGFSEQALHPERFVNCYPKFLSVDVSKSLIRIVFM